MTNIVQFPEVIHTHPPQERSSEIPRGRGGVLKAEILEGKYDGKLKFSGRMGEGTNGGSMDNFWNCTFIKI